MDRILLTTDFSEESNRAFPPTLDLAKRLGLGVTLLHVVVDLKTAPQGAPFAPPQSSPALHDEVAAAEAQIATLAERFTDVDVHTEVLSGESVVRCITDYAGSHDIAMIALSTHGRTGWRHLILGSVAEEVVRNSPVPVVSFPKLQA